MEVDLREGRFVLQCTNWTVRSCCRSVDISTCSIALKAEGTHLEFLELKNVSCDTN